MRASRFVHTMGLTAALVAVMVMVVFEMLGPYREKDGEVKALLQKKDAGPDESLVVEQVLLPRAMSHESVGVPDFSWQRFGLLNDDVDRSERLQVLIRERQRYNDGRTLGRISDVMLPFLGIQRDNAVASSDQGGGDRDIDMSSAFIQKILHLGQERTWMDSLPVLGVTFGQGEDDQAYALKGFELGLPSETFWIVHEPLDDGRADATYLELRTAW